MELVMLEQASSARQSNSSFRRRPCSLVSAGETLVGLPRRLSAASSKPSKSQGGRYSKMLAKVGDMLTPKSPSANRMKMSKRSPKVGSGVLSSTPRSMFSPKGWTASPKKSPLKHRRRLSAAQLDQQFEDLFATDICFDFCGSVQSSPVAPAAAVPGRCSAKPGAYVAVDLDEDEFMLSMHNETRSRTLRERAELETLQALGRPWTYSFNASRVEEKIQNLKQLTEDMRQCPP